MLLGAGATTLQLPCTSDSSQCSMSLTPAQAHAPTTHAHSSPFLTRHCFAVNGGAVQGQKCRACTTNGLNACICNTACIGSHAQMHVLPVCIAVAGTCYDLMCSKAPLGMVIRTICSTRPCYYTCYILHTACYI